MKFSLRSSIVGLVLLSSLALAGAAEETPKSDSFFFRDGDRAMILGDSITEQRLYSTYVESFVLSRFPNWNISFRNTGWSGDTMGLRTRGGLDNGFDRDLKPLQPTAVTIDFGMNDGRAGDAGFDAYVANAKTLLEKFAALGTRVAFITSSAEERYDNTNPGGSGYNLILRKYSDGLKTVAAEKNLPFVDQLAPMIEVIESGRKSGILTVTEGGARLVPDGVHPNAAGSFVMAASILKGLNAPSLVSSVELNAKNGKAKTENAKVSDVKTGDALSFTRLDEAMPWPVPNEAAVVAKIPGFAPFADLSQYNLKVSNLTAPSYQITVDGKAIGSFTKEELAAGVNLTMEAATAMPEVEQLLNAIKVKNDLYYTLWRGVKLAQIPDWLPKDMVDQSRDGKIKELETKLTEAEANVNKLRKPQPHQWVLSPVS